MAQETTTLTEETKPPVAVTPAPATETKPEGKAPTPEEIQAGASAFLKKMGFLDEEEIKETKPETKPEPEAEPKETEKPKEETKEEKPKEETKPKEDAKLPGRIEFDKAATVAPEPVAPAPILQATQQPAKEQKQVDGPTLSDRQRRTLEVVQEIQQNDPEYRNVPLVNQVQEFWQREAEYRTQWQAENPQRRWNPRDDEHNEFYSVHMPEYTNEAYEDAQARIADKRIKEVEERTKSEVESLRFKTRYQEELPTIHSRVRRELGLLAAAVDPEISKVVLQDGVPDITADKVAEIKKRDPLAHKFLSVESARLQTVVSEVESLMRFPGQYKFDPAKAIKLPNQEVFYPHREVGEFWNQLEQELASRPANETMRGGRRYMRNDELLAKQEEIQQSARSKEDAQRQIADLERRYWTVDAEFFSQAYTDSLAEKIKTSMKEWRELIPSQNGGATQTTPAPAGKTAETKPATKKPAPPSMPQASDKTKPSEQGSRGIEERDKAIESRMWGL